MKGWYGDRHKHGLASKGIKTKARGHREVNMAGDTNDVTVLKASTMNLDEGMMPSRMVIKYDRSNKYTPYVTHLQVFPNYPDTEKYHYIHGGYFTNLADAESDYKRRLDLYRVKDNPSAEW